jgi:hypothetical protein
MRQNHDLCYAHLAVLLRAEINQPLYVKVTAARASLHWQLILDRLLLPRVLSRGLYAGCPLNVRPLLVSYCLVALEAFSIVFKS